MQFVPKQKRSSDALPKRVNKVIETGNARDRKPRDWARDAKHWEPQTRPDFGVVLDQLAQLIHRFCKPKVGSSILSTGTRKINYLC